MTAFDMFNDLTVDNFDHPRISANFNSSSIDVSEVAILFPLFDETEVNWEIFNNEYERLPPSSIPPKQSSFPPSPVISMEHNSLVDQKIAPAEIVATGEVAFPYDRLMTSSRQVKNIDPTIMQMTPSDTEAMASNYPSPSRSASPTSNSRDDQPAYTRSKSKDSISIHRRRPGRPSKVQLEARKGNRPTGRKLALIKRQVHNDSAMRSRARFNTVLDELWEEVPECEWSQTLGKADPSRSLHRAERIEIVILYLRKLRRSVRMNECINQEGIYGVFGDK